MILSDDVLLLVVDIYLLVVVGVLVVVGRRRIDRASRDLPAVAAVGEAGKLVERAERPDALHVLGMEALADLRRSTEFDKSAESAARFIHRRRAMKQRCLIYEVGRYGGKISHTQHGIIDAHAVPRHLRVAGRRAAESNGGERGASVTLDEHGRIERQDVGHRQGTVLCLLGNQAMEEQRHIFFPDEYKIPYMKF